jgi:transposase-like protein
VHKVRNVKDHLPQRLRSSVGRKMTDTYHASSALEAEAALLALVKEFDHTHPGAAASLREGLDETLTAPRCAAHLARTLRSTNAIESMISVCREHAANVKRVARRPDGAALARHRDDRGRQAVPAGQRSPTYRHSELRRESPSLSDPSCTMIK